MSGAEVLGYLLREQNSRRISRCRPQERGDSGRDLVEGERRGRKGERGQAGFDRANGSRAHPGDSRQGLAGGSVDAALCLKDSHRSQMDTKRSRLNADGTKRERVRADDASDQGSGQDSQNPDASSPAQAVPPRFGQECSPRECAHRCSSSSWKWARSMTASHCARIDGSCVAITTLTPSSRSEPSVEAMSRAVD